MAISGFPEWLPPQRIIEQQIIDRARRTFELYGFAPLETRAVEPLDQLLRKGETSKEVYLLRRLQADDSEDSDAVPSAASPAKGRPDSDAVPSAASPAKGRPDSDARLGLHFDLTVPFARYVLENAGKLQFPFRRYQIQKCWRGERPQEGRYREFLQADIDIVDKDTLPSHYESELPLVIADVLGGLPIPKIRIQVNNRKVLLGFYRGLEIEDPDEAIRIVDKIDKIGPNGVVKELERIGVSSGAAGQCIKLAEISAPDASFVEAVEKLGITDPLLAEGLEELANVVEAARAHAPGLCYAELKIARGLDYYTGTVYETQLAGFEKAGSICSGGRYDNLASSGNDRYPGVGISLGVTRLTGILFGRNALSASRSVPTCVLVALPEERERQAADRIAASLRSRGIATEVAPAAAKYGKQIRFAERRGIPFVWFPSPEGDTVKDIRSGEQVEASAQTWYPPEEDLYPAISGAFG